MMAQNPKWRVNILGLIGAIVGIIAIFCGWVGASFIQFNLIELIQLFNSEILGISISQFVPALLIIVIVLCIVSPLISLITPVGGILSIIGAIVFIAGYIINIGSIPSAIGPYLCIASGIICVIAIAKPIGLGYQYGLSGWGDRIRNFSIIKFSQPAYQPSWNYAPQAIIPQASVYSESPHYQDIPPPPDLREAARYCENCGEPSEGGSYCEHCGTKVS
jgi:hypothetical protein